MRAWKSGGGAQSRGKGKRVPLQVAGAHLDALHDGVCRQAREPDVSLRPHRCRGPFDAPAYHDAGACPGCTTSAARSHLRSRVGARRRASGRAAGTAMATACPPLHTFGEAGGVVGDDEALHARTLREQREVVDRAGRVGRVVLGNAAAQDDAALEVDPGGGDREPRTYPLVRVRRARRRGGGGRTPCTERGQCRGSRRRRCQSRRRRPWAWPARGRGRARDTGRVQTQVSWSVKR